MRAWSRSRLVATAAAAAALTGCGAGSSPGDKAASTATAAREPAPPPVFDVAELDPSIAACTDFNGFVNARWIAANPIPDDRTRWGAFDALSEQSLANQRTLVERAARNAQTQPGSVEQKIGNLFASGMDEAAIDAAGFDPIKPKLGEIAALQTPADVTRWLSLTFSRGDQQVFGFYSSPDFQKASLQIAYVSQSGLGLPTPEYYSSDEYREIRDAYTAHMARLFELTGTPTDDAARRAAAVLAFETRLAGYSLPPVELRDPVNRYHFVSLDEANRATPHFDWRTFFAAQGVDVGNGFSLSQPKFFAGLDEMLATTPVEQWRDYLTLHVISDGASYLSEPFQEENFAFNGKTLNGQPEQRARWKRVLDTVNGTMGEALGQLYVAEYFPPEAKSRAEELVTNVRSALKTRIENLEWMSDATKEKALAKWEKFLPKIGYPETWRDWSGLSIAPSSYYDNVMAGAKFNYEFDIRKIGTPTDRMEWSMTPQTVNAYYSSTENTINFPAAILQPPFFYANGDDAINYGGIGAVIGHESSHGFDDQGSKFDGDGNNVDWWTKEDRDEFDARTAKLVEQFNGYAPIADQPDKHVNGMLTLGENIADLAGSAVAYDALQTALAAHPAEAGAKIDGYTQDQRFFMNWARVWRSNVRDKRQLVLLNADPHAPAKFRAIGPPSNLPAFATAFQCSAGDEMVRAGEQRVRIW